MLQSEQYSSPTSPALHIFYDENDIFELKLYVRFQIMLEQ